MLRRPIELRAVSLEGLDAHTASRAGYDGRHLQLVRALFRQCREVELLMRNSFCGSSTFVSKGIRWRRGPVASLEVGLLWQFT
jgi:hypothetical protein